MSASNSDNQIIKKLINYSSLNFDEFDKGIEKFLSIQSNAILLAIGRGIEGLDDHRLEFGIRLYWSESLNSLN